MSSCDSSGEDFMGRRLRQLQQDYNQRKYVGWATEEEIAARQAEMERSVRKEVKIVTAQQQRGPSNPSWWVLSNLNMIFLLNFQEQPLHLNVHKCLPSFPKLSASPTNFVKNSVC